ncbi:L,D-transpeptidase family protein [Sphingomonas sabuli]|uniref:L,D-transpeptidase family protein n=1 Tax=Sphingomonas sabuli TaxID=2764186 RepID=A0A7G9L099_9SPHN|nr:L,D-transpeptidase family protein [Sphingomonas sabuli]QNM82048.1 L,D-transpeptidase family protein [Sphingomonas sabuli]
MTLKTLFSSIAAVTAVSAIPFAALAQQPMPVPMPVQQGPQVAQPPVAPAMPVAEPAPLPLPLWDVGAAQELLGFIRNIGAEGLSPTDYAPQALSDALASGDPMRMSEAANASFTKVASDLALGHVRGKDRVDWHIKDPDLADNRIDKLLRWSLHTRQVAETLNGLMPKHPQYSSLKRALEVTPKTETAKINRIRLNMDRWRWLPQDLGERYIIVNVPAYTAALVENGDTISRHYAVAGAIKTPTPQLSVTATGVIINPWWEIPSSIAGEVRGKAGYVAVKDDNGKVIRWRQPPGPSNALGKMKFVMPNAKAIYLHDTNAKSRFNARVRAFSHGCIRTKDIDDLATILLSEGSTEWTGEKVQQTLASGKTVEAKFPQPLPVYIVYMSSAATVEGKIIDYSDVYKRDVPAIAALGSSSKATAKVASR